MVLATSRHLTIFNNYAHNDYLMALAEGGVVGFLVFLGFLGTQATHFIHLLQRTSQNKQQQQSVLGIVSDTSVNNGRHDY